MNPYSIVNHYGLEIGDRIIRERGVFPRHQAIYVGPHNGTPMVAEKQFGRGIHYIPMNEFLLWGAARVKRVDRFRGNEQDRKKVIPGLNKLIQYPHGPKKEAAPTEGGTTLWSIGILAMLGGLLMTSND